MAIPGCTTKYLILPQWDSRGDRGYLPPTPPRGKVGISLEKMVPNLSRTVCIEKLTESVSITGLSLSGMVGVSWHIFDRVSWHIYIKLTNIFWNKLSLFQVVGENTIQPNWDSSFPPTPPPETWL